MLVELDEIEAELQRTWALLTSLSEPAELTRLRRRRKQLLDRRWELHHPERRNRSHRRSVGKRLDPPPKAPSKYQAGDSCPRPSCGGRLFRDQYGELSCHLCGRRF